MPDPVGRKTHNFDPDSFKVPKFRTDEQGNLNPTDYQAAMALRNFMKRNNEPFITREHLSEANSKGTVTFGDRVIQVNAQDSAMFAKLQGGLFNRLDAGTNGTHDGVVGVEDINDAIRNSLSLHGNQVGHWTSPAESASTTKQQGKERLLALLEDNKGSFNSNDKQFKLEEVHYAINDHKVFDKTKENVTIFADGAIFLDDRASVEAFSLLLKDFDMVDTDKNEVASVEEIRNWQI